MLSRQQLTLEEKLKKFKWNESDYAKSKSELEKLGYTEVQIEKIILKKYSKNTVEAIIRLHNALIHNGFNHGQITEISSRGGACNLDMVIAEKETLRGLGFSDYQIVRMVSHDGGSKNLKTVVENKRILENFGFSNDQIVQMVSHTGGANSLAAVIENRGMLTEFGFANDQIVRMASLDGGSNILNTVTANKEMLRDLKFTPLKIMRIVLCHGGSKKLEAAIAAEQVRSESTNVEPIVGEEEEKNLEVVGESTDQESELAPKEKLKNFKVNESYYLRKKNELKNLGYTEMQAEKIILRKGSKNSVEAIIRLHNALINEFNHGQIVKISSHPGGANNLEAVIANKEILRGLGFTNDQIVRIVSHSGGANNLAAVIEKTRILKNFEFSNDQIVRMASSDGGSNNLKAVIANKEMLRNLGFTNDQIVRMASYDGGSNNLKAVIANKEMLRDLGFTNDQIVLIVSRNGGSKKLEAAIAAQVGSEPTNVELIVGEEWAKDLEVVEENTDQEREINDWVSSVFNDRDEFGTQEYSEKKELTGFFGSPHLEKNSDQIDFSNSNIIETVEKEKEITDFNVSSFFNDSDEFGTQSDQIESPYCSLGTLTQNSTSPLLHFYSPRQLENDHEITEEQDIEFNFLETQEKVENLCSYKK